MRRWSALGTALLLAVAACSSSEGQVSTDSTRTSAAGPTTTTPQTTTLPPATTTTMLVPVEAWDIGPKDLVSPLEILDSFSYQSQWLATDVEGEESGWAVAGEYVGPSATHCRLSQASLMGFTPTYEVLFIDEQAWREDVLLATYETSRADIEDFLGLCPGAEEFWGSPVFYAESLSLGNPADGGLVSGERTLRFEVASSDDALTLDTGWLWVTEQAWPIRFEMSGSGSVSAFNALFGLDSDDFSTELTFRFSYELADINGPSLMVRAPDGSASAGPLGEIVAQIPEFEPSSELAVVVEAAESSPCAGRSATLDILARLGGEPDFDSLGVSVDLGTEFRNIVQSSIVISSLDDRVVTSAPGSDSAKNHALLFYNHMRGLMALWYFTYQPMTLEVEDSSGELAIWDGNEIEWFDNSVEEKGVYFFLRYPDSDLELSETANAEAQQAIDEWAAAAESVFTDIQTAHPQAVADLKALVARLSETEALLCARLGTAWLAADAAYEEHGDQWVSENPEVLFREMATQEALLALEYLEAIAKRLSPTSVDYFNASGADLAESMTDQKTSDLEYTKLLASAGLDALAWYQEFSGGG